MLRTDGGATPRFALATKQPTQVARCVANEGEILVWVEEASGCVDAPGLLTTASSFLAVHVFDPLQLMDASSLGRENIGWAFGAR